MTILYENQIKSKDAEIYWNKIGTTIRYMYGVIISSQPKRISETSWPDLPLGVRSRISREMNRLQHRVNRQVKSISSEDRERYGIRYDVDIRRPKTTQKTWDKLYHTAVSTYSMKRARQLVYRSPKNQQKIIQDDSG